MHHPQKWLRMCCCLCWGRLQFGKVRGAGAGGMLVVMLRLLLLLKEM